MIDTTHAINYLQQVVNQLKGETARLNDEDEDLKVKKDQLVLDRKALTDSKSAFLKKTDGYGKEVKRVEKMLSLAKRMKAKIDEDRMEFNIDVDLLNKRELKIDGLEAKQKQLEEQDKLLAEKETEIEERELLVTKEKKANRSKQEYLNLKAKSIKKKQLKLQKMIDIQRA